MQIKERIKLDNDLVLHVRNVHFFLVIFSILVFFFTIPPKKIDVSKLDIEYQYFDKFTKAITASPSFIASACYQHISSLKLNSNYKSVLNISNRENLTYGLFDVKIDNRKSIWKVRVFKEKSAYCELGIKSGFKQYTIGDVNDVYRHQVGLGEDLSRHTKNLLQFIDLWNGFSQGIVIHRLEKLELARSFFMKKSSRSKVIGPDLVLGSLTRHEINKNGNRARLREYRLSLIRNRIPELNRIVSFSTAGPMSFYLLGSEINERRSGDSYLLVFPLQSKKKIYSIQGQMLAQFSLTKIEKGKFKTSFPNLYEFIRKNKGLYQLADLYKAIDRYRQLDMSSYKIFGLVLKIETIARFACFTLIVILLYYWLLIRGIIFRVNSNEKVLSAAWIGLFQDNLSYIITLASALLLPILVCVLEITRYFHTNNNNELILHWFVITLLFIVSVLVLVHSHLLHKLARGRTKLSS